MNLVYFLTLHDFAVFLVEVVPLASRIVLI